MKKKRPPKTIKEKKWLIKTIEYGDGAKAAMEVYDVNGNASARAIASQNFSKLSLDDALLAEGLTEHSAAKSIKEGLEAMKIHGTSDNFIEIQDKPTQHKYLETFLRLKGHGPAGVQFNQQINMGKVYVQLPERK